MGDELFQRQSLNRWMCAFQQRLSTDFWPRLMNRLKRLLQRAMGAGCGQQLVDGVLAQHRDRSIGDAPHRQLVQTFGDRVDRRQPLLDLRQFGGTQQLVFGMDDFQPLRRTPDLTKAANSLALAATLPTAVSG